MTTRNESVLIVWGVAVSMKHSNHMKITILKPQKRKKLSLPSGNKSICYFRLGAYWTWLLVNIRNSSHSGTTGGGWETGVMKVEEGGSWMVISMGEEYKEVDTGGVSRTTRRS